MGYTEVSIHFPEKIAGKAETVSTLALVIPDYKFNAVVPVLVGTNTLDTLFKSCVANDNSYAAPKDADTSWDKAMVKWAKSNYRVRNASPFQRVKRWSWMGMLGMWQRLLMLHL